MTTESLSDKNNEYFKNIIEEFGKTPEIIGLLIGVQTAIQYSESEAIKKLKDKITECFDEDEFINRAIDEIFGDKLI